MTTSGSTSVPIGVSSSTAPVMPTTTTRSTCMASSRPVVPVVANSVPIPVTMATTRRPSMVAEYAVTAPWADSCSPSLVLSGSSSIGMAQMKAISARSAKSPDVMATAWPIGRRIGGSGQCRSDRTRPACPRWYVTMIPTSAPRKGRTKRFQAIIVSDDTNNSAPQPGRHVPRRQRRGQHDCDDDDVQRHRDASRRGPNAPRMRRATGVTTTATAAAEMRKATVPGPCTQNPAM